MNQTEVDNVLSKLNLFRCNPNGNSSNEMFFKIKYQYLYNLNKFMIKDKRSYVSSKGETLIKYSILKYTTF